MTMLPPFSFAVAPFDDLTLAGQILRRKNFRLFGEGDLPGRPSADH